MSVRRCGRSVGAFGRVLRRRGTLWLGAVVIAGLVVLADRLGLVSASAIGGGLNTLIGLLVAALVIVLIGGVAWMLRPMSWRRRPVRRDDPANVGDPTPGESGKGDR